PESWTQLTPAELAGLGHFRQQNCSTCHKAGEAGVGPDLTRRLPARDPAWTAEHLRNPQSHIPGSQMPPVRLPDPELRDLAAFVVQLTPDTAGIITSTPDYAVQGATLYQKLNCQMCHQVN